MGMSVKAPALALLVASAWHLVVAVERNSAAGVSTGENEALKDALPPGYQQKLKEKIDTEGDVKMPGYNLFDGKNKKNAPSDGTQDASMDASMDGYKSKLKDMKQNQGEGDAKMPGYGAERGNDKPDPMMDGYKKKWMESLKDKKGGAGSDTEASGYENIKTNGKPAADAAMNGYGKGGDAGMEGYGKGGDAGMEGYGKGAGADGASAGYGKGDDMQKGYGKMFTGMSEKGFGNQKATCPEGQLSVASSSADVMAVNAKKIHEKRLPEFKLDECVIWNKGVCYHTCGMTNSDCVKSFTECMEDVCATQHTDDEELTKKCKEHINTVQLSGNMVGNMIIGHAQANCECLPEDEAHARNKKEVHAFYQKWAPDQVDKADGLFEKYKTKIPHLMLKLRQKYRNSVVAMEEEVYKKVMKKAQESSEEKAASAAGMDLNNVPDEDEL